MTTKTSQHTPGPWKATLFSNAGFTVWTKDHRRLIVSLSSPAPHKIGPEDAANARLIATAPALLEALETALSAFRGMYDRIEAGEDTDDLIADERLWPLSQIRTAIAQAKGETE